MAGAALVSESGWDRLSLRSVAERLSVTPMALYRHVPDCETLMTSVLNEICTAIPDVLDTNDLERDLGSWARALLEHLRSYPGVAGHLMITWFEAPAVLARVDSLLGLVRRRGLDGFEAVAVTNAVFTYVLMRAEAERQVRSAGVEKRQLSASPDVLAHLSPLAEHYTSAQFDAHFDFGLDALIAGALKEPRR